MESFILKALARIRSESSRREVDLREECDRVTALLQTEATPTTGDGDSADKYFRPFQMACDSKNSKIKALALDCIQKLISWGWLVGARRVRHKGIEKPLIDVVIDTICDCRDSTNDQVQLQVIKALLTAVSSNKCEVHQEALLTAVRACYNIFLHSRNQVNRTTAKATLTQMLNIVFQRMENEHVRRAAATAHCAENAESSAGGGGAEHVGAVAQTEEIEDCQADSNGSLSAVRLGCVEQNMYEAVRANLQFAFHQPPSRLDSSASAPQSEINGGDDDLSRMPANVYRDAFLLFRALCKLSMKDQSLDGGVLADDPIAQQSKILSLELLSTILDSPGRAFRETAQFMHAVKTLLCVSLLKNYGSSVQQVATLSFRIYLVLLRQFRSELRHEMETFISTIFLRTLNSSHSAFETKVSLLQVFKTICQDAVVMTELFLNFDCKPDEEAVFEPIVQTLASIAQGRVSKEFSASQKTAHQHDVLRRLALDGMVEVITTLSVTMETAQQTTTTAINDSASNVPLADDGSTEGVDIPDDASVLGSESVVAGLVDHLEQKRRTKDQLTRGAIKFRVKPRQGVAYFEQIGRIDGSPESVAALFHELSDVLDKTQMGDYMGEGKDFNIAVMHAYVDQLDFAGLSFVDAVRLFLAGFRLPGEAQKIDRLMEKFAERYCTNNPSIFPNADTAFILAYSVIMLHTDAHNPNIKPEKKMTKDAFVSNNRGIANGDDLPREFLSEVYDSIIAQEFTLRDEAPQPEADQPVDKSGKRRRELAVKEREDLIRLGAQRLQFANADSSEYFAADQAVILEHILPMFDCIWAAALASLSVILETASDMQVVDACLRGYEKCIFISGRLGMATQCKAFVLGLSKFTGLESRNEFEAKHIQAIRTLILVAQRDGTYFHAAWEPVIWCMSEIHRLHLTATGARADGDIFSTSGTPPPSALRQRRSQSKISAEDTFEQSRASLIMNTVVEDDVDRIFAQSVRFTSDGIISFVEQLCRVSIQEISHMTKRMTAHQSRVFSLQKVVEVADANMGFRPRVIWSRMWDILSSFFATVGSNKNQSIAMFAIDSLKQLSMKFLDKEELQNFNFQSKFLSPFLSILTGDPTPSLETRELILHVIGNMIRARGHNLRSGWKPVFAIHEVVAGSQHGRLVDLAFDTIAGFVAERYEVIRVHLTEAVKCLVTFAGNQAHPAISMKSLDLMRTLSMRVARDDGLSSTSDTPHATAASDLQAFGASEHHLEIWWPLLTGLAQGIGDPRVNVRTRALDNLMSVLQDAGGGFDRELWSLVFRGVLLPLFDDVQHVHEPASNSQHRADSAWLKTTCMPALASLVKLHAALFAEGTFLLDDLLNLLSSCILQDIEGLARIGVACFRLLLTTSGHRFSDEAWTMVCTALQTLFQKSQPQQLVDARRTLLESRCTVPCEVQQFGLGRAEQLRPDGFFVVRFPWGTGFIHSQAVDNAKHVAHILHSAETPPLPFDSIQVVTQCVVQLELISSVGSIIDSTIQYLKPPHIQLLVQLLDESSRFARAFNADRELREALWRAGFMRFAKNNKLPSLLRQETQSTQQLLALLFALAADPMATPSDQAHTLQVLTEVGGEMTSRYADLDDAYHTMARDRPRAVTRQNSTLPVNEAELIREYNAYGPLVLRLLQGFKKFDNQLVQKSIDWLYPLLVRLIRCGNHEVRVELHTIFADTLRETLLPKSG